MPAFSQSETADFKTLEVGGDIIETLAITLASGAVHAKGSVLGRVTSGGAYKLSASAASDGSQTIQPMVLMEEVDATGGAAPGVAYIAGKFDPAQLVIGAGHTLAAVRTAFIGSPMFVPDVRNV